MQKWVGSLPGTRELQRGANSQQRNVQAFKPLEGIFTTFLRSLGEMNWKETCICLPTSLQTAVRTTDEGRRIQSAGQSLLRFLQAPKWEVAGTEHQCVSAI